MDIKRLHYFRTIVEQGQISRAAKVLNMSQPPLSQRLKELEEELGVQLIVRDGGRWQVTDSGQLLYERSRQLISQLESLASEVRNAADGFGGRITIGISTTCLSWLRGSLPGLQREYPRLSYRLEIADSTILEGYVKEGRVDLAILLLPLEDTVYQVHSLPSEGPSLVYSPAVRPPQGKRLLDPGDVDGVPLLALRRKEGGGVHSRVFKHMEMRGARPRILMESPDVRVLLSFLLEGMQAAAILPNSEVSMSMRSRLTVRPLDAGGIVIQPVIIHLRERFLTTAARLLIERILIHAWPAGRPLERPAAPAYSPDMAG